MAASQHPRGYRDRPCELCEDAEIAAERRGFTKAGLFMLPISLTAVVLSVVVTAFYEARAMQTPDPAPVPTAEKVFTPKTARDCSLLSRIEKKTVSVTHVYVERAYVDHETDEIILVVLCP